MPSTRRPVLASIAVALAVAPVLFVASPASAGGGCHRPDQTEGRGTEVELSLNCMNPTVLHTDPGATVTFVNREQTGFAGKHNVFGAGWGDEQLLSGESFVHRFDAEGVYPFACLIHPGMVGAIVVGADDGVAPTSIDTAPIRQTVPTRDDGGNSAVWTIAAVLSAVLVLGLGGGFVARRLRRS